METYPTLFQHNHSAPVLIVDTMGHTNLSDDSEDMEAWRVGLLDETDYITMLMEARIIN